MKVLVIDDNRDLAETLGELIQNWGHTVELAYTGPEGLAAVDAFRPHVILCDIGLPEMDGYTLGRAILAHRQPELRWLIAVSGYSGEEDRIRSLDAGFDGHLAKPVDLAQLRRLLHDPGDAGVTS